MANLFAHYCALLGSKEHLVFCQQANSLTELLARIKQLWQCLQLNDDELLGELNRLNQLLVDGSVMLAGNWLPHRYQARHQQVHWLIPVGHATEPFHDEYLSRCAQHLFNQIIQPRTSLGSALQQAKKVADVQPAGCIFHLSRCGSTLISGCLSELDSTCVFSEPPLLTELLLDNKLTTYEQRNSLSAFINLQAAVFPGRPHMIIKWNAWDIFRWDIIRSVYPLVPAIFLVRNPEEILASHQRSAGRHMSGDPGLAAIHPCFSIRKGSLLAWRTQVLAALLAEMNQFIGDPLVVRVDYRDLDEMQIQKICNGFGVDLDERSILAIHSRLQFHSKTPGVIFASDVASKQAEFDGADKLGVQQLLMPIYNHFFNYSR